ncbi:MAG: metal-binding protein [Prochlorococcaceae cyanobacterium]
MASGQSHDRATWALALPFGALWWPWLGLAGAAIAAVSFLAGGLLLSPDLDTRSNATRRWGPLRLLWWPYRRGLSHRSLLSHTPLIGTAGRLLYLLLLGLALCLVARPLGAPPPEQLLNTGRTLWQQHQPLVLTALVGLEASAWLHLIQDGDPVPRLPRVLRRRRTMPKRRRAS